MHESVRVGPLACETPHIVDSRPTAVTKPLYWRACRVPNAAAISFVSHIRRPASHARRSKPSSEMLYSFPNSGISSKRTLAMGQASLNPRARAAERRRRSFPEAIRVTASTPAQWAVVMLLAAACTARTATACEGRVFLEGKRAPAAVGESLTSQGRLDLDRMKGRPVVVNFWGSWCAPCRGESPVLAQAWGELSPTVGFLGVDIRDERAPALAFVEEFGLSYPHIYDREATIAAAWGVVSPPATFVVSAEGQLVGRFVGVLTRQDLDCMLALA